MVPGAERFFQANEHDVKRAGLELDGLARLDFQSAFDRPHLRDATLHLHLMKFEFGGDVRRSTDEAIGRRSVVFDRHVAGSHTRAFRRRARPWIGNVQRSGLIVGRTRGSDSQSEGRGKEDSDSAHFYSPDQR
jgi:hypothetical protein